MNAVSSKKRMERSSNKRWERKHEKIFSMGVSKERSNEW